MNFKERRKVVNNYETYVLGSNSFSIEESPKHTSLGAKELLFLLKAGVLAYEMHLYLNEASKKFVLFILGHLKENEGY